LLYPIEEYLLKLKKADGFQNQSALFSLREIVGRDQCLNEARVSICTRQITQHGGVKNEPALLTSACEHGLRGIAAGPCPRTGAEPI
jgi:hypothetical protein